MSQVATKNWRTTERKLAADIVKAANAHALDILCLSELGELGVGIGKKLPEGDAIAWIHKLLADRRVASVPGREWCHNAPEEPIDAVPSAIFGGS